MNLVRPFVKLLLTRSNLPLDNCRMMIVVRSDIVMTKGKIGAQCAHAAIECYRKAASGKTEPLLNAWLLSGQPKIVVRVQDEKQLLNLAEEAKKAGIITAVIRDAGRTQLQPGTISVLGIGPVAKSTIDPLTAHLKLL